MVSNQVAYARIRRPAPADSVTPLTMALRMSKFLMAPIMPQQQPQQLQI